MFVAVMAVMAIAMMGAQLDGCGPPSFIAEAGIETVEAGYSSSIPIDVWAQDQWSGDVADEC